MRKTEMVKIGFNEIRPRQIMEKTQKCANIKLL